MKLKACALARLVGVLEFSNRPNAAGAPGITVTPTAAEVLNVGGSNGVITVNVIEVASGGTSGIISLNPGPNTVIVRFGSIIHPYSRSEPWR